MITTHKWFLALISWMMFLLVISACTTTSSSPMEVESNENRSESQEPAPALVLDPVGEDQLNLPSRFQATALPHSFKQPTQFALSEETQTLWVAEINGSENGERGRVTAYDLQTGEARVILTDLDKPTGIAILNGELWIATRDQILKAPLPGPGDALPVRSEVVLRNLPNNGRSNGTLTISPDQKILYETSGSRAILSSGRVFALDPETEALKTVAKGLKGGYAHAFDQDGNLWLTEVADGRVQGVTLPDEINFVAQPFLKDEAPDFGWPTCYGRELAGPDCNGSLPAVTTFPAHATPTGIAVSPFDDDTLFVAHWVTGEVIQLPVSFGEDGRPLGDPQPFITGMQNPQHLVSHDGLDGAPALWVSDYALGTIYLIQQR